MANYLASIFGTEQDKVRHISTLSRSLHSLDSETTNQSIHPGQLLLLLQDWRMPPRRPLFAQTRQAFLLPNHPPTKPLPEPGLRSEEQDEPVTITEPFRCFLRGFLVRDVQVRRDRGGGCL